MRAKPFLERNLRFELLNVEKKVFGDEKIFCVLFKMRFENFEIKFVGD